jgi:iron complex transport system substrate-binding protein
MTHFRILCGVLAACVFAVATANGEPVTVHDAAGRDVTVNDTSRIVSIGGAATEILYALGVDDRIVGVDTTSLYPPRAMREKPNVGYMRQLSAEGVLGLRPSLVLAMEGSGPKETMSVLEAAKVPLVIVPDSYTPDGIVKKIELIARTVRAERRGACLAGRVKAGLAALDTMHAAIKTPKRVVFVISMIDGRALVAGDKTAANGIITLAGAVNAISGYDGYKPVSNEALIAARPDVVLAMSRPGPGNITADTVFSQAAFAATPAGATRSFVSMEGLYLLGFGPRTAHAAHDLAAALYPGLKLPPVPPAPDSTCPK